MLSIKIKTDTLKIELRLLARSVLMTFNRNLIAVIVLVLFAASLLITSLDYTSGIMASRGEPGDLSSNHTDNTDYSPKKPVMEAHRRPYCRRLTTAAIKTPGPFSACSVTIRETAALRRMSRIPATAFSLLA